MGSSAQGSAARSREASGVSRPLRTRISELPWKELEESLDATGYASAGPLLGAEECSALIKLYGEDRRFRKRVDMARHNFGDGDYAYFDRPLPRAVRTLQEALYMRLVPTANRWNRALGRKGTYPQDLSEFHTQCRRAGQVKPTPLLLRYVAGGFNCLHRDLYGELAFPIQAMVLLSAPGRDFRGGEFLMVENRARQQSRGAVLTPGRGELVLFANNERPAEGARGILRASMRHGVSPLQSGKRFALGIIFHNAA